MYIFFLKFITYQYVDIHQFTYKKKSIFKTTLMTNYSLTQYLICCGSISAN